MKVLVVDDDPSISLVLETALEAWGYEVWHAINGQEALEQLQAEDPPRLVLLDWMMPQMTGPDICRKIRETPTTNPTYIIMLTAKKGSKNTVEGLEAGADDYLAKPFDPEELRARVRVGERMLELQSKLAERVAELERTLEDVRKLHGMLPICFYCQQMRTDKKYLQQVESYIAGQSKVEFSHNICEDCFGERVQPKLDNLKRQE